MSSAVGQVGGVEEGGLGQADVDERGLHAGQHRVDAALVDVADVRRFSPRSTSSSTSSSSSRIAMRVSCGSALMTISLDIGSPQARRRLIRSCLPHDSEELFTGRGLERGDHAGHRAGRKGAGAPPGANGDLGVLHPEEKSGEIEWPQAPAPVMRSVSSRAGKAVVAATEARRRTPSVISTERSPCRALMYDVRPVMGVEMADGLVERGAKGMWFRVAE